jgi:sn-glycerol 3-phosphate transport system ATP-binding protein
LLSRKPAQLSGGQRQRVALARSIVAEHPLCLMDEPLSNLDARLRSEMRREIRDLQQRLGMTVIYVTHDQVEAMSMGDRIVLLEHGRVVQDDTPQSLYNRPGTVFAGSFIGSPPMNLVALEHENGAAVIPGIGNVPLARAGAEPLTLGIRPEAIRITADAGETQGVPAYLTDAEYLGSEVILGVQAGDSRLLVKTAHLPDGLSIGAPCRLHWDADAAHFFAGNSGIRLGSETATSTHLQSRRSS